MSQVNRKKVVYLLRTLNIGGAERYVVETASHLNRERFEPKIYCISTGGDLQADAEQSGVAVTSFQGASSQAKPNQNLLGYFRKFLALCRYLKREQPDIVHCYMYTPSIYGGIAAKLTSHALILTNRMRLGGFKEEKRSYQWLENFVNRFVDGVLVNSNALKEDVLRRERIAPEKLHVVYGGVDLDKYVPCKDGMEADANRLLKKRELGIPTQAPVIGSIANLFWHKGYREFIRAAAEVHRHYPEAHFLCIGEDRGIQSQLDQLVRDLGMQQQVIFTGQVRKIEEIFPIIDIQVSASHEEGFSSAIIEGMASGKPIVATAVGGTPEAVRHNLTGFLVPPNDPAALAQAIKTLLDNPELALQFGRNGRKRIEEYFSTQTMLARLESLYLALCEEYKPSGTV